MSENVPENAYGLLAEFPTPGALLAAARRARRGGYTRLDAFSPYQVEGLAELVGFRFNWLPILVLLGGFGGAAGGYFMQWYASVVSYPLNVAGRPPHSWPSFVPITFEIGVLAAALVGFFSMLFLSGLPRPHHPVFSAPNWGREMRGGFFLVIEARDPIFDAHRTRRFLEDLNAREVHDVEK